VFLLHSRERELDELLVSTEEVERVSVSAGSGGIDGEDYQCDETKREMNQFRQAFKGKKEEGNEL